VTSAGSVIKNKRGLGIKEEVANSGFVSVGQGGGSGDTRYIKFPDTIEREWAARSDCTEGIEEGTTRQVHVKFGGFRSGGEQQSCGISRFITRQADCSALSLRKCTLKLIIDGVPCSVE
jgi:hypothetical protein